MKAVKNGFKKYSVLGQCIKKCPVAEQIDVLLFLHILTNLTHPPGHFLDTEFIGTIEEIIATIKRNLDVF